MSTPDTAAPFAIGYGTNGFTDHTLDDALRVLAGLGYEAIALTLGHPHLDPFAHDADARADRLARRLGEFGMRVVVETGARYLLDPRVKHHPTLVSEELGRRIEFLQRAVELAERLDAECVSFWSGVLPAGTTPAEGERRMLERLPALLDTAERHGVTLALEPEPGMAVETVGDALRLREALGSPALLGITVDLGHCVAVEPHGVDGALREAGALLRNVQVDDMVPGVHEHLELGHGELDLPLALATLAEIGYCGVAAMEFPRHSHDAPALAARSIAAVRAAWESSPSTAEERSHA
ncbi:sugar phosphate isomerase/epimerase family protein [Compostimonas suwonensis]|uniref:Sugar phosphate isomerase/epimerase n=1 Tax=Compostimonas suwonensis TaxID=1048394 RepID=A0A2M9BU04_9MICO|nr:sugar phosphate isomerase/epimerase family protein [Compostimonas suwonensis]PJJ61425.1 sugar phosphate isomerase/epimerase [Compostimonas suwonensis]